MTTLRTVLTRRFTRREAVLRQSLDASRHAELARVRSILARLRAGDAVTIRASELGRALWNGGMPVPGEHERDADNLYDLKASSDEWVVEADGSYEPA